MGTDLPLECFSFSTKLRVGEFLEQRDGTQFTMLSEAEIDQRFLMIEEKAKQSLERTLLKQEMKQAQAEQARRNMEERDKKKAEKLAQKEKKAEARQIAKEAKLHEKMLMNQTSRQKTLMQTKEKKRKNTTEQFWSKRAERKRKLSS